MRRPLAFLFAIAPLCAQAVHRVGPGGFAQIQPAIDAAADGDVIEIAAGVYRGFTCAKGLTLAALPGAQVDIAATAFSGESVLFLIPAGRTCKVDGLAFRNPIAFFFSLGVEVRAGRVAFAHGRFEGHSQAAAALAVNNAAVWLHDCTLLGPGSLPSNSWSGGGAGGGAALRAQASYIAAIGCTFVGGALSFDGAQPAGHGIHAEQSTLQLDRCTAIGGTNNTFNCGVYPGGDGVHAVNAFGTWIADCTLTGGAGNCGQGGFGLANLSTTTALLARGIVTGGAGSTPGAATTGPVAVDVPLALASVPGPILLGATWAVDWTAPPGLPIALLWGTELAPLLPTATIEAPWLPGRESGVFAFGAIDANGLLQLRLAVPNLTALRYTAVWLHAFGGVATPFRAAVPVGGLVR